MSPSALKILQPRHPVQSASRESDLRQLNDEVRDGMQLGQIESSSHTV